MSVLNPKVDFYFGKAGQCQWAEAIEHLRTTALDFGLTEDLKWGCPCYTQDGRNIVLIHVFKEYCAYLFFKGAAMKDPKGILVQQTENVQAARQVRFTNAAQVLKMQPVLTKYIKEAIHVAQAGIKIDVPEKTGTAYPEELKQRLDTDKQLKAAFEALTPGRQRAYNLYFAAAKQAKTREARIDKCIPEILAGKGLND